MGVKAHLLILCLEFLLINERVPVIVAQDLLLRSKFIEKSLFFMLLVQNLLLIVKRLLSFRFDYYGTFMLY